VDGRRDVALEDSAFWEQIRLNLYPREAGVAVDVSETTAQCWFRETGGVKPQFSKLNTSGRRPRLSLDERIEIQTGVHANESLRSIGRRPDRPASTIKRKIDNNSELRNRYRGRTSGYRHTTNYCRTRCG
jgi:transposase, IS30 family